MTAPAWAEALVAAVCAEAAVPPPQLGWRRRAGVALDRRGSAVGGHDQGAGRCGRARSTADAAPRAGPLALAPGARATGAAPRPRLLPHGVRPLPTSRVERGRCAAPRGGTLSERHRPRGRAGHPRRPGCARGTSVPTARPPSPSLAGARPGASRPARSRRTVARVRDVPAADRGAKPRAHPSHRADRAPRPDGGRARLSQRSDLRRAELDREGARQTGVGTRSRASAAASASRITASGERGQRWTMRWLTSRSA